MHQTPLSDLAFIFIIGIKENALVPILSTTYTIISYANRKVTGDDLKLYCNPDFIFQLVIRIFK